MPSKTRRDPVAAVPSSDSTPATDECTHGALTKQISLCRIAADIDSGPRPFLLLPEVKAITCSGTTKIYALMKCGKFPKQVKIGHSSCWVRSEVEAWVEERIAERDIDNGHV
jgi:prophage regulatory protein